MLKSYYRVYINDLLSTGKLIVLSKSHHHYLKNVLRLKEGDQILVFNSSDGEFYAKISYDNRATGYVIVGKLNRLKQEEELKHPVILAQCVVKPERMNRIIDMSTQAGVKKIIPIMSQYSQGKLVKQERWEKIIVEACEQSNRITIPSLDSIKKLEEFLEESQSQLIVCANEKAEQNQTMHSIYSELKSGLQKDREIIVLIGPEGGFSARENELMNNQNILQVSLGSNVLRSETAALYALAQIHFMITSAEL